MPRRSRTGTSNPRPKPESDILRSQVTQRFPVHTRRGKPAPNELTKKEMQACLATGVYPDTCEKWKEKGITVESSTRPVVDYSRGATTTMEAPQARGTINNEYACPECGRDLVCQLNGKNNTYFWACSGYTIPKTPSLPMRPAKRQVVSGKSVVIDDGNHSCTFACNVSDVAQKAKKKENVFATTPEPEGGFLAPDEGDETLPEPTANVSTYAMPTDPVKRAEEMYRRGIMAASELAAIRQENQPETEEKPEPMTVPTQPSFDQPCLPIQNGSTPAAVQTTPNPADAITAAIMGAIGPMLQQMAPKAEPAPAPVIDDEKLRSIAEETARETLIDWLGGIDIQTSLTGKDIVSLLTRHSVPAAASVDVAAPADAVKPYDVPVPKVDANFWCSPEIKTLFAHQVNCAKAGERIKPVLLKGPKGSGKTETAQQFAAYAKLPFLKLSCPMVREPRDWFGYKTASGGAITWIETEFVRNVRQGNCVILLDEISRTSSPAVLNSLLNLLDGTGSVYIEEVKDTLFIGPNCHFWATANLGSEYTGAHSRLDAALNDRFSIQIEVDYLQPAQEADVLCKRTGIERENAEKLVRCAKIVRDNYAGIGTRQLSETMTTRRLIAAAEMFTKLGKTAFEFSVYPVWSKDGDADSEQKLVREIFQGQFGV